MAYAWKTVAEGIRTREHATRKHGMKPDAYFAIRYYVNGKRKEEGLGWSSQGWTLTKAKDTLAQLRTAQKTGQGETTLSERREVAKARKEAEKKKASLTLQGVFYEGYLTFTRAEGKKETTIKAETGLMENYIIPFFGETSIYAVDVDKVSGFVDYLRTVKSQRTHKPLSNQTIKHALNLISQIFNYARSRKKIAIENPVQNIKKPSTTAAKRERWLTRNEAKSLLDALKLRSIDTHDMALIALLCGLRAGEVLRLTWACVNFGEQSMLLRDTKNRDNRHAYMTPEVEAMLRRRWTGQGLDERVFLGTTISSTFDRIVEEIGLNTGRTDSRDRVVFHTLRHTFASWHAKRGTPLYTISKLLGHKSVVMTQRYAHLCPSAEKQAVMALSGALDEKRSATVIEFEKFRAQGGV